MFSFAFRFLFIPLYPGHHIPNYRVRASQIHGVPRKTLRNWMKRWHIKSVYPMPYQLKKAAEMKRQTVRNQMSGAQTSNSTVRIDLSESETNEY